MVCKETVKCPQHGFLLPGDVHLDDGHQSCRRCEQPVEVGRVEKMSKSKKNVVDPNVLLERYGADTTRLFCLFAAPPERDLEWSEQGVEGGYRFLNRVWRLAYEWMGTIRSVPPYSGDLDSLEGSTRELYQKTHWTIKKVTADIEDRFHFNTAISAIMELFNVMSGSDPSNHDRVAAGVMRFAMESLTLLISPIVPHFAEEIWRELGFREAVLLQPWPVYDQNALVQNEVLIVAQVNGKLRSRFRLPAGADEKLIEETALNDEKVQKFVGGKPVKKVIVVRDKLVNIVV
jgi:leucyl-tRNA synthetase